MFDWFRASPQKIEEEERIKAEKAAADAAAGIVRAAGSGAEGGSGGADAGGEGVVAEEIEPDEPAPIYVEHDFTARPWTSQGSTWLDRSPHWDFTGVCIEHPAICLVCASFYFTVLIWWLFAQVKTL